MFVSAVQYVSISFLYIHNLRLLHFSQLKGCSRTTLSCDSSYIDLSADPRVVQYSADPRVVQYFNEEHMKRVYG